MYGMCQCPQRASTHFYGGITQDELAEQCVNALNGLLLISTDVQEMMARVPISCVNALNGLLLISTHQRKP